MRLSTLVLPFCILLGACEPETAPGGSYGGTDAETTDSSGTGGEGSEETTTSTTGNITFDSTRGTDPEETTGDVVPPDVCDDYNICIGVAHLEATQCKNVCKDDLGDEDLSTCIGFACAAKCSGELVSAQIGCTEDAPAICVVRDLELLRCRQLCFWDAEICFAPPHCPSDDAPADECQSAQDACLAACNID